MTDEEIGALCARDYKGCSVQWMDENKFVIQKKDSSLGLKTIAPCHCGTSQAHTGGGSEVFILAENEIKNAPDYIVRRLTPKECCRLQAYPDDWCDIPPFEVVDARGKKRLKAVTDSDKYKALGNSIATCAWTDILQSMAEKCEDKTLGSLFDGIGGFPLIWERDCGGKAVWASEIEPYCIAVTKYHFPEEGEANFSQPTIVEGGEKTATYPDATGTIVSGIAKQVGNTQDNAIAVTIPNSTVYDSHPNDSRVTELGDTANSVCSRYGTGGNNTPLVQTTFTKK